MSARLRVRRFKDWKTIDGMKVAEYVDGEVFPNLIAARFALQAEYGDDIWLDLSNQGFQVHHLGQVVALLVFADPPGTDD